MKRSLSSVSVVFALGAMPAQAGLRYTLHYDAASESMQAELCGADAAAERRFVLDRGAQDFVGEVVRSSGVELQADGNVWVARDWHADECLRWRAALGRIADRRAEDVGWRVHAPDASAKDDDLVVAPQQWLFDTQHDAAADVDLALPPGHAFSAPWQRLDATPAAAASAQAARENGATHWRIPPTPRSWSATIAVGRFAVRDLRAGEGVLHLAMTGVRDVATQDKLAVWIDGVGRAALSAYGRLPQPQVQVLALPTRRGTAVSFGQSTRGQGHGLILLIDPQRPLAEFSGDWTAVHEFAHLFHPYLGDDGRWLAEGLATYWQNVLRARAGLLTPAQAWEQLHDGFARGRAQTRSGRTLAQASAAMMRERAFLRTYWAGAAYWLGVDVELRRASGGQRSVDDALSRFQQCCFDPAREWSPQQFVAKLDALLGSDVFVKRWREAGAQTGFPDLAALYATLGIIVDANGKLRFDDEASASAVRRAIMEKAGNNE